MFHKYLFKKKKIITFQKKAELCLSYFILKKRKEKAVVFDIISFYCNACTRCIFVAINILNETEKRQRCLI